MYQEKLEREEMDSAFLKLTKTDFFFLNPEPINKSSSVVEAKEGISEESKNPKLWVCVPCAGENLNLSSKLK